MYIGFISYSFGENHQWICKDWKEMYEYCKDDLRIEVPETEPINIETGYFQSLEMGWVDTNNHWISISKASDYFIQQAKEYFSNRTT